MKTLEEIKNILEAHKGRLKERFGIKEIGISDVFDLLRLERSLRRLLRCKVDVVRKQAIREELRDRILSEVIEI